MRRLGTTAAMSLSVALIACGSDSTNPGPQPDARVFDAPPPRPDAGPDAGAAGPDAGEGPDAGPSISGTIAIHSLEGLNPATGEPATPRFGQINISFAPSGPTLASESEPQGALMTPCFATAVNVSDVPEGVDQGNVTLTVTHSDTSAGPTIPTCTFDTGTKVYTCGAAALPDLLVDGDKVAIAAPSLTFTTPYSNAGVVAGGHLVLDAATKTLLSSPIDVSGTHTLTFTADASSAPALALVAVIDATDATDAGASDLGTNAMKTASLTCSVIGSSLVIPAKVVGVLGTINPTKLRVSIFHDGSDVGLVTAHSPLNVVAGQGFVEFQNPAAPAAKAAK
jgi:hypothetical protein